MMPYFPTLAHASMPPMAHVRHASNAPSPGQGAAPGWPTSPRLEALRDAWMQAPTVEAQQQIARDIQRQAFEDVPYLPTGQVFTPVAHRADLVGLLNGLPAMWNVRRG